MKVRVQFDVLTSQGAKRQASKVIDFTDILWPVPFVVYAGPRPLHGHLSEVIWHEAVGLMVQLPDVKLSLKELQSADIDTWEHLQDPSNGWELKV
jgi:hypothetical protein